MIDYKNLSYHPLSEEIVSAISEKVGTKQKSFFRIHVAYYLSVLASMMRTTIHNPGMNPEPANFYAVNLAPSGFGKGYSTDIIESNVIHKFQRIFVDSSFPILANVNLPKIAQKRAIRKNTSAEEELMRVEKEFENHGKLLFSFDSATSPAVKQLRNMLLMADAGSMNLQTDEIGANLTSNKDVMMLFLELFNGRVKNKLVKNTTDSIRTEEMRGITPTNMMLFGVPAGLLDGGVIEQQFINMQAHGYARRCFYGFIEEGADAELLLLSPEEQLKTAKEGKSDKDLERISNYLAALAAPNNNHSKVLVPDDTAKLYFEYKNDCITRANSIKSHDELRKSEMRQRFFKTLKLAGTYAFIDQTPEVSIDQFKAAIALAEESGESFKRLLNRDRPYVRLAKYFAATDEEVTHTDIMEDLPFFKGIKSYREDLLTQARDWGHKNNILIKKRHSDNIEFLRGESLEYTDLSKIVISYSQDLSDNYKNETAPFDKLYKLIQQPNLHWINHHLKNGHRDDDSCVPGFNIIVIDVDKDISLQVTKSLLKDYKALYYTTKRHTEKDNRFRIILPTNFKLKLNKIDFKQFMSNVFNWLPFDPDRATGQPSRKWLTHSGSYEYTEGKVLDILPFIPETPKNDKYQKTMKSFASLTNLERWMIQNTEDGNRNNQLMKYAYVLVDMGYTEQDIQKNVLSLNSKLEEELDTLEILTTIMETVRKAVNKRDTI